MISSSVPWPTTPTFRGSGCTSRGGFVPRCNDQTAAMEQRTKGTPQGGVVSPLLANLFLHYAFDVWMRRTFPAVQFERYADDAIVHCSSKRQAEAGAGSHPGSVRAVRSGASSDEDPDRLLQGRRSARRRRARLVRLPRLHLPTSTGEESVGEVLRELPPGDQRQGCQVDPRKPFANGGWHRPGTTNIWKIWLELVNPTMRGWMNYYGRFYRSKCLQVLRHFNEALAAWVRRKYKTGFVVENARRCIGWVASRGGNPSCLSRGNSA